MDELSIGGFTQGLQRIAHAYYMGFQGSHEVLCQIVDLTRQALSAGTINETHEKVILGTVHKDDLPSNADKLYYILGYSLLHKL